MRVILPESRADARRERNRLLDLWQMADLGDKNSARLSGGERRLQSSDQSLQRQALPIEDNHPGDEEHRGRVESHGERQGQYRPDQLDRIERGRVVG